ncbi:MAG: MFS transporter [Alphaproteobacteria bacterium]|nr:MFS transporter [Alphaproteobacteria bacterium]
MNADKNLRLIGYFAFVTNAFFFVPVALPFYIDRIGLGYQELLLGESAFAAACILFDIPTSWISDVWNRKSSLILGAVLIFLAEVILIQAHNVWHMLAAQIVWGVGLSLLNGTIAALLYDTLLSVGRQKEYRKFEGKRLAMALYGIAFAGPIGGLVYPADNYLPLYLGLGLQFVGILLALLMDEPKRHKVLDKKHPVKDILSTIAYVSRGHATLGVVILYAGALFCSTKILMWSQQPYFIAMNLPKQSFGFLMAIGWLIGGMSSQWSHLLDGKVTIYRTMIIAWTLAIAVCIGAGLDVNFFGVCLLMFGGSCLYGMVAPRVNEVINRSVRSSRRATALSTQTLLTSALFIPVSSVVGWMSDRASIKEGLFSLAIWLALAGIVLLILKMRLPDRRAKRIAH